MTISGGDVTAHGGHTAACIGGGFRGSGDVTILGGTVTAIPAEGSNSNVTGIGGGFGCDENRPFVSSAVLSMPWATDVEAALAEAKVMRRAQRSRSAAVRR